MIDLHGPSGLRVTVDPLVEADDQLPGEGRTGLAQVKVVRSSGSTVYVEKL